MDLWDDQPAALDLSSDADLPRRAADHLCRELEGLPFKADSPLTPIRPVVLSAPVRTALSAATRYLVDLVRRVCWSLTDDPADLARRTGLGPNQIALLGAGGTEREIRFSSCNVRSDAILRNGIPVFLECNFGAANGFPVLAPRLLAAYRQAYGLQPRPAPGEVSEPFESRLRLYRRICDESGLPHSVVIIGTMRDSDVEDIRYFEAEALYMRAHGFDSDFVEPKFFDSPSRGGRRYSVALKHFLPEGLLAQGVSLDGIARAHTDTMFMVSDSGLSLSSKLVFAWLSAESVPLSDADRDFVRRHIPWTRLAAPGEVGYEGRQWDLVELADRRRTEFVLKPLNSCGGQGVLIGSDADPGEWRSRLEHAALRRDYVLQQYVESDPLSMDFFDARTGELRRMAVAYVLGPYVVDDIYSGCSLRHVAGGGPRVVNHLQGASFNIIV